MIQRKKKKGTLQRILRHRITHYIISVLVVSGVALLSRPLANTQNYHLVSYILLLIVSMLSTFMGIGPVLLASTLSALLWNFFFIPPHLTFHIESTDDILIFSLFFIIALVNGILTTRVRRQEQVAREREQRTNALFQLSKELSRAGGTHEVLEAAGQGIRGLFGLDPVFVLQDGNNVLVREMDFGGQAEPGDDEFEIAEWVFNHVQKAGAYTDNPFPTEKTFYPMKANRIHPGVLIVKLGGPVSGEQKSFWDAYLSLISNALEREFLGEMAQKVRFLDESDRLYKTLFNSISHELRIPVATIMGASDTMLNTGSDNPNRSLLVQEIFNASIRLNRLIENLLNISRLESGHIGIRLDWCDVNDLVNKVTEELEDELKPFTFEVVIPDDMPLVRVDFGLMEQVLYNLLYNSTQYARGASVIRLEFGYSDHQLVIELADEGPGFPPKEIKHLFEKFYRVDHSRTGGLGLGLSIVKGFVEAHNGEISAKNRKEGGACFNIAIPSEIPDIESIK